MNIIHSVQVVLSSLGYEPDDNLLVGVSGGPDSLVLADVLHKLGWQFAIAHFDHQLRPSSQTEREMVGDFAASLGVPFYYGSGDIATLAAKEKKGLEEKAREARYTFLFRTAQGMGAKAVVTAHNADDQAETILMHILRGSGLDGLTGMRQESLTSFHPQIQLVRPLLYVWREEIEAYCKQHDLQPVIDESNQDIQYLRNRVRHELIPELESYNVAVKQNLVRLAEILQDDRDYLEADYDRGYQQVVTKSERDFLSIDLVSFSTLHPAAQKAVLKKSLHTLLPSEKQVEYSMIAQILEFVAEPPQKKHITLAAALHAFTRDKEMILTRQAVLPLEHVYPHCQGEIEIPISSSFKTELAPGCVLIGNVLPVDEYLQPKAVEGFFLECYLDLDSFTSDTINIRASKPGERYAPLGMRGNSMKISDLLVNKKIPVSARAAYPILLEGGSIIWIPGFQPAHAYRIVPETTRLLHLRVVLTR